MLAHVDMDAFYAAVEKLDDPRLEGRPVIVGGGGNRGVVSAASYEARAFGVRSAMPMFQARRLCPGGEYRPVRMARYRQVSRVVMDVLAGFSPLVEPVSVDEAYLDLSGTERLWGAPEQTGRAVKEAVNRATGLTCSVGLAPVRFLAKIASDRDKPDGLTVVGDVEEFLQTVTLKEVPGVGRRAQERLGQMGITRLVELRLLGGKRLEKLFGSWGHRLWDLAHGRDDTPVTPSREVKSISHELTLETDTADRELLSAHLLRQSRQVARRLRRRGLVGRTVVLKLKTGDMRLITRSRTLPEPSDEHQDIHRAARELLEALKTPGPFRLVGVGMSGLMPAGAAEAGLFGRSEKERRQALNRAEDAIVARFGAGSLFRAGETPARRPSLDRKDEPGHNE